MQEFFGFFKSLDKLCPCTVFHFTIILVPTFHVLKSDAKGRFLNPIIFNSVLFM